jgi:E3 ubiquitin-protein ligase RNF5
MEEPSISRNGIPGPASNTVNNSNNDNDIAFACNICLDGVKDKDPVVTQCGHLYCWPCLYRWLHSRHGDGTCPVCKANVSQENVIPIFIRGSICDPRTKPNAELENIPSRPQAHRPEPAMMENANQNAFLNPTFTTAFGGTSFGSGFGFFPSLFGLQFQSFAPAPANANEAEEEEQRKYLSRVLLLLGFTVILCLLFF